MIEVSEVTCIQQNKPETHEQPKREERDNVPAETFYRELVRVIAAQWAERGEKSERLQQAERGHWAERGEKSERLQQAERGHGDLSGRA